MKTYKTIAYGIFAVILALSLAGCPDPEPTHTHDYSAEWSSNETQHWHECSCGEKTDAADHTAGDWIVDQAATATIAGSRHKECTVCGYETATETIPAAGEGHIHDYATTWSKNATQHWHECSCGEKTDVANHTGDPCDICGYASGSQNPDICECNGIAGDCDCDDCDCETCEEEIVIPSYTVTFDADNGSEPTTQTVTEGDTTTKPADPAKNGYGFVYWFNIATDTEWDFNTPITANLSLKAKWNIQYTVTFDADNGMANTTQIVTEGNTANKPSDPSKTYTPIGLYVGTPPTAFTFVEWQKPDGSAWNFTADTVTANITLTAQWTSPSPIDITNETGNNIVEKAVSYVNANGGSEYTLVLGEDVSNVAPQTLNQDDTTLTITSDGNIERKIIKGEMTNGNFFYIGGSSSSFCYAKLVINGHVTLESNTENAGRFVAVAYGGSLELKGYAKLTKNGSSAIYGVRSSITMSENAEISYINTDNDCVYVGNSCTFTMSDNAVIKNNGGRSTGGGVRVGVSGGSGSVFIMNGGEISHNIASFSGGGVFVANGATFTVANENVKMGIHDNTATYGPQVYVEPADTQFPAGTFTVGGEPMDSF
jgi:uncharacterized repeat protein (TIGR02543 family)